MKDFLTAAFLGFIEGLTEFIPVSSTGHLVILVDGLNFAAPPGHVFEVFIQLGAILAVAWIYRQRIQETVVGLPRQRKARTFTLNLILGTLPAVFAGAAFHAQIKSLYEPVFIACMLILGGIVILLLERRLKNPRVDNVDDVSPRAALLIGCFQMLALIPGVSRSGATVMGALGLGLSRPAAAEFSFFLAMPVMFGAVLYDGYKNWDALKAYPDLHLLAVGFVMAFVTALVTVRLVMRFIARTGFAPFAWYRIAAGLVTLALFAPWN